MKLPRLPFSMSQLSDLIPFWRRKAPAGVKPVTVRQAQKILGENFISHKDVASAYKFEIKEEPTLSNTVDELKLCAKENKHGEENVCFYRTGISPRTLIELYPQYFSEHVRVLAKQQEKVAFLDETMEPSYRIINFKLKLRGETREAGLKFVQEVRGIITPARRSTVIEALLTLRLLRNKRMLLDGWHHGEQEGTSTILVSYSNAQEKLADGKPNEKSGIVVYQPQSSIIEEIGSEHVGVLFCLNPNRAFEPRPT